MESIKCILPANFNLFTFGDLHLGSRLCHINGILQLIEMMNSEYNGVKANYGVFHGDAIEAIMIDDPRYYPADTELDFPDEQVDAVIELMKPIAKKLLVWLNGNHERKLWKFGNLAKKMAKTLNVPYGTYTARLEYVDRRADLIFKHYATHGRKSINSTADDPKRRTANLELILKRHLKFKAGDCVLMTKGHTHKTLICRPTKDLYIRDDGDGLRQAYTKSSHTDKYIHPDHRWYLNTGAFFKLYGEGYSSYAEIAEYDPIELGFPVVEVRNREIVDVKKVVLD